MTIYQKLEDTVLDYLHQNLGQLDPFPGATTPAQVEDKVKGLILIGAQNALKQASQKHSFSFYEVDGYVIIPANGVGSLRSVLCEDGIYRDFADVFMEAEIQGCPIPVRSKRADKGHIKRFERTEPCLVVNGDNIRFNFPQNTDIVVKIFGHCKPHKIGSELSVFMSSGGYIGGYDPNKDLVEYHFPNDTVFEERVGPYYLLTNLLDFNEVFVGKYKYSNTQKSNSVANQIDVSLSVETETPITFSDTDPIQIRFVQGVTEDNFLSAYGVGRYNIVSYDDPMLEESFEYLQWATIVEVNHLLQQYTPRTEGTLPPPTSSRDAAFESLVIDDSYKHADSELIQI